MRWKPVPTSVAALAVILFAFAAVAQQQKPNILVIMADDIGYWKPRSPAKKIYATPKSPPTRAGGADRWEQQQILATPTAEEAAEWRSAVAPAEGDIVHRYRPLLRGRHQTSRGAGDRNVSVEQRY
jgi:hypothetical protein